MNKFVTIGTLGEIITEKRKQYEEWGTKGLITKDTVESLNLALDSVIVMAGLRSQYLYDSDIDAVRKVLNTLSRKENSHE
jgi:hypothetical protein